MPATPSQLRRPIVVEHTVDFGDGITVAFRFDRNRITDAWLKEWERLEAEQDVGVLNEVLADLIQSWDVVNEDGSPYPLSAESIGYLFNLVDKGRIVSELMTTSRPGAAEGNDSANISGTAELVSTSLPASPLNGHPPSPSPRPSESLSTT